MATWVDFCRTERGKALDAKLINGSRPLTITKAMSGGERVNPVLLPALTQLPGPKQTLLLSDKLTTEDPTEIILPVLLQNKGLEESYRMHMLGIYAEDPDLGEILYMVCQTTTAEGEEIPAESVQPAFSIQWNHCIKTADASKVTVEVPEAGLLTEGVAEQRYAKLTDMDALSQQVQAGAERMDRLDQMVAAGEEAPESGAGTKLWVDTGDGDTLKYFDGDQWTALSAAGGGFVVGGVIPAAGWSSTTGTDGWYTNRVTIEGMKAAYNPLMDLVITSAALAEDERAAFNCIMECETFDGYVIARALDVPEIDVNVRFMGV